MTQIIADKREIQLVCLNPHNVAYPFHGFPIEEVTPYSVNGVSRVNYHATAAQYVHDMPNLPRLGIDGMYSDQLCLHGAKNKTSSETLIGGRNVI
jgi:hypothetical protein